MARISIELPDSFSFAKEIELTERHMNIGNHLDNALLLTLVSEARTGYWSQLGYSPFDLEGVATIVADAAVVYKAEAFSGEIMVVEQALRDFHQYGFDIVWRVSDKASGREVARGKHGVLCFNFAARKVAPIPATLLAVLQADNKHSMV